MKKLIASAAVFLVSIYLTSFIILRPDIYKNQGIFATQGIFTIDITMPLEINTEYTEFAAWLNAIDYPFVVYIHNTGYGGNVDSLLQLLDALNNKFLIVKVEGFAYSANAAIACKADVLVMSKHSHLLIHLAHGGNDEELLDRLNADVWYLYTIEECGHFLTEQNRQAILRGEDVILTAGQIREQWNLEPTNKTLLIK